MEIPREREFHTNGTGFRKALRLGVCSVYTKKRKKRG